VCQQISMSLGVAVGASALHLFSDSQGGATIGVNAFIPTFLLIGFIPIVAILVFVNLPAGAGDEMRGRGRTVAEAAS